MYIHNLQPELFTLGFFSLRWYSLAYIFGILVGWWLSLKIIDHHSKIKTFSINKEDFSNYITYIIISIVIGGRLGYVLFYNINYYISNPIEIFKIWNGGMAFHGALLGIVIGTLIFCNKRDIKPFLFLDIIACVSPIGIFFGRIANFINGELYGKITDQSWGVIFPSIDKLLRHPSQIYEALLEGLVLFLILIFVIFRKDYVQSRCSYLFLILYSIFRIISEQFREPDLQLGYLFFSISMGTILSVIMFIFGIVIFFKSKQNANK